MDNGLAKVVKHEMLMENNMVVAAEENPFHVFHGTGYISNKDLLL